MAALSMLIYAVAVLNGCACEIYGDKEPYFARGFTAFAAPWSTYPGGKNEGLVPGVDFANTIQVVPSTFPGGSLIRWQWPTPGPGSVAGYFHIARGNYDGSSPAHFTPLQVANIDSFTETVDYELSGSVRRATVLNEFYLTTKRGEPRTKVFEIGHWLHTADLSNTFFDQSKRIGTFVDPGGVAWDVADAGPNAAGAIYIVFRPTSREAIVRGTIDKKAVLDWLVAEGIISDHLWVNGTALGVEPFSGEGAMLINTYSVEFSGSGTTIPTR